MWDNISVPTPRPVIYPSIIPLIIAACQKPQKTQNNLYYRRAKTLCVRYQKPVWGQGGGLAKIENLGSRFPEQVLGHWNGRRLKKVVQVGNNPDLGEQHRHCGTSAHAPALMAADEMLPLQ